jgi:uracil-DNA glycosylase family 4
LDLSAVVSRALRCRHCATMRGRSAVLGPANGPASARVMFIAEAPGRLGADRTGIPLFGDRSGDNFELLLSHAGLQREEVFITNTVLCNPRDAGGRNRRPSSQEVHNCSRLLEGQIDAVSPAVIVTLGATALRALRWIGNHDYRLASDAGRPGRWRDAILLPLYHPSPRTRVHRSFERQIQDFETLGKCIRRLS